MIKTLPDYQVYALHYAHVHKTRNDNFIMSDPHDSPMPMDYFTWLVIRDDAVILVDTGFDAVAAKERGRTLLKTQAENLASFGLVPEQITDVIITHLHYDHAGNMNLFPNATFHIQEREVAFATGRYMKHRIFRGAYDLRNIKSMMDILYGERVAFYDGDAVFRPGIELLLIGGHTMGLQSVRVHTRNGWVVLASDASHYYDNIFNDAPFPIVFDVGAMLAGYDKIRSNVDTPDNIVPGHDPEVLKRYQRFNDLQHIVRIS